MIKINDEIPLENGCYKIIEKIDSGGQGIVWKAQRQSDGVYVALKSVNIYTKKDCDECLRTKGTLELFIKRAKKEVHFLDKLGEKAHVHYIVSCLDKGNLKGTHSLVFPIFVMPLYEHSLVRYTYDYHQSELISSFPFTIFDLLKWLEQIATALHFIHQQQGKNVHVHRDIKPANILLNTQGNIGVIDFGITRGENDKGTHTSAATRGYCAPEQRLALFKNKHKHYLITSAIDCYSLGLTFHELLVGSTRAQNKIYDNWTVEEHDDYLLSKNKEKTGYLGKIGGLTKEEKEKLKRHMMKLIEQSYPVEEETLVTQQNIMMLTASQVTTDFSDYLETMLSPWPYDRPKAIEIKHWCQIQQQAFEPRLDEMTLAIKTMKIPVGEACQFTLYLKGRGLHQCLNWLELFINEQPIPLADVKYDSSKEKVFGYLKANERYPFKFSCPLPDDTTHYKIRLFAQVGEQTKSAEIACELIPTAKSLWHTGQQKEALQQEIHQEWLEQYQYQQFKQSINPTDLTTLIKLATFYQTLEKIHPDNEILATHIAEKIISPIALKQYIALTHKRSVQKNKHENDSMQFIQGGAFQADYLSMDNEALEKIMIDDFYLGKTPVTVKEYKECVEVGACQPPEWLEEGNDYHIDTGSDDFYQQMGKALTDDNHPIVGVSWHDAMTYAKWLSVKTGAIYYLPTEAEWEYATRAGSKTHYPWGDVIDPNQANYNTCQQYPYTSPVASFAAYNGLYDMQGNVWEWTSSQYKVNDYHQVEQTANNDPCYILRGGAWLNKAHALSLSYRYWNLTTLRRHSVGFRLAQSS